MSITKNHHFIPVFYLKYFTNDDGSFYVYDVKRGEFKGKGKKFFPNSHFYEVHANTTTIGSAPSDYIERNYTKHDTEISDIFKKIDAEKDAENISLTPEEWTYLQYYVSILYWRIPANMEDVDERIMKAKVLKDLGIGIRDINTNQPIVGKKAEEFLNRIKMNQNLGSSLRLCYQDIPIQKYLTKNRIMQLY